MTPIKFYLVTDTHYYEPSLGASGKAYEEYMKTEQILLAESSDMVKAVFAQIMADKETEYVILPGDLSKNGEKESHNSFIKELYKLKKAGKKVYVITAGHDYNEWSRSFVNDECVPTPGVSLEELYDLYYDFGYSEALAVDKQTLSYVAEIAPKVRLLAVNCDSSDDAKGVIDDRLLDWLQVQIDDAKKNDCFVFAINHYPIIPSVPVFDLVGDAHVKDWRKIASFFADNGVELAFTGHMHIQSINEFYSKSGNRFVDICTSATVGSPVQYRKIDITADAVMTVETLDVPDFGWDLGGLSVREFCDRQFVVSNINKINRALDGDEKYKKLLKKFLNSVKISTLGKLLFIKPDKSIKDKKFMDFAGEVGCKIFAGDQPYVEGTAVHSAVSGVLKRFNFIIKKVEPKLQKGDEPLNLTEMLLNTIANNKGFSDNNAVIKLKNTK
ncbi:MAG: metallophosphoesterase [Clostridia bacterium]|nr:metallophosphoesterase [Clostridia bacterium]